MIAASESGREWPAGSLLAGLSEPSRRRLLGLGTMHQYAGSGRVLIREGIDSTVVYLLLVGTVKATAAVEDGDALLAIRVGGDVVGEFAALDGRPRSATVTTAGPVVARVIPSGEFNGLLSRDPGLALAVARSITDKLRTATARRTDFTGCDVATRFARVLLDLTERYGEQTPAGWKIGCPLTQTELASLAGAAEPTLQRTLRLFRAEGIVGTGYRETTVLDLDLLRKRAFPRHA